MESGIELVLKITVKVIIEGQFWFSYVSFLFGLQNVFCSERGGDWFFVSLGSRRAGSG